MFMPANVPRLSALWAHLCQQTNFVMMAYFQGHGLKQLWRAAAMPRSFSPSRFQSTIAELSDAVSIPGTNQPDYAIPVDKATSTFTPVPKRVQYGSEDILPATVISGAPIELQARSVRIYQEAKPATQSGDFRGRHWRMDWDILPKGHRWVNPLIGWQSSADCMQGTHLNFNTKEDAIHFAEKQGYEYSVQEPNTRKVRSKAYANNFLYSSSQLEHIRTK